MNVSQTESQRTYSDLVFRPFLECDRQKVTHLLSALPDLYPEGDFWLQRRLSEVQPRGPSCTLLEVGDVLAGVAIETPKDYNTVKLSTFYISPCYRYKGYGRDLIRYIVSGWRSNDVHSGYVTVAHTQAEALLACFRTVGFKSVGTEWDRYGVGRHEVILAWEDPVGSFQRPLGVKG